MKAIEEIIKSWKPKSLDEAKLMLRELLQQITLVGLSRASFFEDACFYGGTALRIFYGLNRYSEDLDFTLKEKNLAFSFAPYLEKIKEVASSYGMNLEITMKEKKKETPIESAFAKLNTRETFIELHIKDDDVSFLHKDELIKVKFEVDCSPALGFKTESKWLDVPEFANVVTLDEASLFAGKIHAILCRNYKNTVKGRDYYDFLFYTRKRIKPNLLYLQNKLIDSGKLREDEEFNLEILQKMLKARMAEVDWKQVKDDASRFLLESEDLSYYNASLFVEMIDRLG